MKSIERIKFYKTITHQKKLIELLFVNVYPQAKAISIINR